VAKWLPLLLLLLAPGVASAQAIVAPDLAAALADLPSGETLGIGVVLETPEALPAPGEARRAAVSDLQDAVLARLPAGAFATTRRYASIAGLAGRADAAGVAALAADPGVARITLDGRVFAQLQQGRALIGANAVHGEGLVGAGVTVVVVDTGIDSDHPDLADDLVDEHCFCAGLLSGCCPDGTSEDESAEDDQGHGTAVAGIVSSAGVQAPLGVAPGADLVAVKALGSSGSGNFSDTAAALDWVLTNHAGGGPLVVNMSLGDGEEYASSAEGSCSASNTANAIAALHAAGVAVFVASGNEGHDAGISFPACVAEAISVGGVYDDWVGTVSWCGEIPLCLPPYLCTDDSALADTFVCHSNSGPNLDLLAPDFRTATSALGGGVEDAFGGTSAAAPYAAAEAALLLEADPTLTPEQIRALLTSHGPLVTNADNGMSYPRSDVALAVEALPEPAGVPARLLAAALVAALARARRRVESA